MASIIRVIRMGVLAGLLIAVGFAIGTTMHSTNAQSEAADESAAFIRTAFTDSTITATTPQLTSTDMTRAELYERVAPSVVSLQIGRGMVFSADELDSSGSGFVIDTEGRIVTNYHVVQGAEEIIVRFFDGTITRAEIIGLDADSDIAVIQVDIPEERLVPVTFGNVDDLVVGESVVAIGSPFGQDWTLTSGIISAKNRSISGLGGYSIGSAIQTDTPINPGNSGGPLLTMRGEVVGVTSQILSRTRSNSGIGFAVPSDLVVRVVIELIENGRVAYSFIGISGDNVTLDVMERGNLANNQRGVVICQIVEDSPAAASDLRPDRNGCRPYRNGDIIVSVDGTEVLGFDTLISYLARNTRPGDTVTFGVLRNGETVDVQVMLGNRPGRD